MYSIVEIKGKQYKIEPDTVLSVDHIDGEKDTAIGDIKVLLLKSSDDSISVGNPYLDNVTVKAKKVEDWRDKKVRVVRYKPNAGYIKRRGHRQKYTKVYIEKIEVA